MLSGKALKRNHMPLCELMQHTLEQLRFDEPERVRELIAHTRARTERSITGQGHGLAMGAAAQYSSPAAQLGYKTSGLQGIKNLRLLDQLIENKKELNLLMQQLQQLHQKILAMPRQLLLIGEGSELAGYQQAMSGLQTTSEQSSSKLELPFSQQQTARELWVANSQVNFCAKAYASVPTSHRDAAPLTVLGDFMRNNFLHTHIREQGGAYGGGASQDNYNGAFRLFSYRDPRMEETLQDFDRATQWLLEHRHDQRLLEEAILGVVAGLDKPSSPAGEAKQAFHGELFGRGKSLRQQFRERVMQVEIDDLKRVTETYLQPEKAHIAVITGNHGQAKAAELGLQVKKL